MLKKLAVDNYALIEHLELDLSDSLNIITGETGAGKTILLGALGLLVGGRGDASLLKDTERNCIVEGVFQIGNYDIKSFFSDNDLDYKDQTVVRRIISPNGKSRAYINDLPVQQATLKEFGQRLIDIHSQHQSLMLADDGFRTGILDSVALNVLLLQDYKSVYYSLKSAEREFGLLKETSERSRQDEEWLRFQVEQLESAGLKEGEQEELETERDELSHAGEIKNALTESVEAFNNDNNGILLKLKAIEQDMSRIRHYSRSDEFADRIHSSLVELRDIEAELSSEAGRIESDPRRLELVEGRLDTIYSLSQKHKVSDIGELLALLDDYRARLDAITGGGEAVAALEKKISGLTSEAMALAGKITAARKKAATLLSEYVEKTLSELGMPSSRFAVEIKPAGDLRPSGTDDIRFMFSANRNIPPAPVEKIASGGEVSRLMLALQSLAAKTGKLPTIIFDEIDAGVSGRIADAMGDIINGLAANMQVINITHLPQIASKGNTHLFVYKDNSGASTQTKIIRLDGEDRVNEIAKMLSGSTVTDAARKQARLLLGLD